MNRFSRKAMTDWEELMSTPGAKEALKEYVAIARQMARKKSS